MAYLVFLRRSASAFCVIVTLASLSVLSIDGNSSPGKPYIFTLELPHVIEATCLAVIEKLTSGAVAFLSTANRRRTGSVDVPSSFTSALTTVRQKMSRSVQVSVKESLPAAIWTLPSTGKLVRLAMTPWTWPSASRMADFSMVNFIGRVRAPSISETVSCPMFGLGFDPVGPVAKPSPALQIQVHCKYRIAPRPIQSP